MWCVCAVLCIILLGYQDLEFMKHDVIINVGARRRVSCYVGVRKLLEVNCCIVGMNSEI